MRSVPCQKLMTFRKKMLPPSSRKITFHLRACITIKVCNLASFRFFSQNFMTSKIIRLYVFCTEKYCVFLKYNYSVIVTVSRKFTKDRCGRFIRYFLAVGIYEYYVRDIISRQLHYFTPFYFKNTPEKERIF